MRKRQILASFFMVSLAVGIAWGVYRLTDRYPTGPRYTKLDELEKKGMPEFAGLRLNGEKFSSSELGSEVTIINFWASWCDPCVAEYPSMVKLVEHFKGNLRLVAVSGDSDKKDIETFLKAFGGVKDHIDVIWDPEMVVAKEFGTSRLPESYIFYSNRKLARKVVGLENWYTPDSIDYFNKLINSEEQVTSAP